MTPQRPNKRSAGFTVVELLVTTLLTGVVLAAMVGLTGMQVSASRDQSSQIDLQQNVRNIAEMFAREVRRAGANPTCSTSFTAIESASGYQVRFKSDLNGNGSIDSTGDEDVTYQNYFGELRRIANGSIEVLLTNAEWSSSKLRYFDKSGIELSTGSDGFSSLSSSNRSKIRRIEFTIDVEQKSPNGEVIRAAASSDVSLRNRFFIKTPSC